MSDFIFSNKIINKKDMEYSLHSIYESDHPQVTYFSGTWGSLGITKNIYNGFEPYETDEFLIILIGGPLLTFRDNSFIKKENSNEGTISIFERWVSNDIIWHKDVNGPFACIIINKYTNEANVITDIMSFIPIYESNINGNYYISSHVDMLANIANLFDEFDEISILDFILHGTVTYPYTLYKNIFQIQAASYHIYSIEENNKKINSYWEPFEYNYSLSLESTAHKIQEDLEKYISMVTKETNNIAQFISGGEDSRTLSGLLKKIDRDSYIYIDEMNREGRIAQKIARKYNADFNYRTRDRFHYLYILEKCSDLIGTGAEYHHAHTYGFHKELGKYDGVFGGLFSDALLKGARIKKTKLTKKFIFLTDKKNKTPLINEEIINNGNLPNDISKKLKKRRLDHLNLIRKYRNESPEEWFELWPSSMNRNIPNIYANRRLFKSYEPFLSNEIVKKSAIIPQKWKMNRILFYKIAKPYLRASKYVIHSDGWYPYYSNIINGPISFCTWTYRQFGKRLGYIKGNQGPWAEWGKIIKEDKWQRKVDSYKYSGNNRTLDKLINEVFLKSNNISNLQYISFTQTLYQLKRGENNERKNKTSS